MPLRLPIFNQTGKYTEPLLGTAQSIDSKDSKWASAAVFGLNAMVCGSVFDEGRLVV
jgi:hypothetical protein